MSVCAQTRHFQSQAVTILAIATGAIGFGLFDAEFRVSMETLPTMKFVAGGYAIVCYMLLVVFFVVSVFVVGIFEGQSGSSPPA